MRYFHVWIEDSEHEYGCRQWVVKAVDLDAARNSITATELKDSEYRLDLYVYELFTVGQLVEEI